MSDRSDEEMFLRHLGREGGEVIKVLWAFLEEKNNKQRSAGENKRNKERNRDKDKNKNSNKTSKGMMTR